MVVLEGDVALHASVGYIEVVGLSRILCCQGINLLHYRQDAIALALVANQEGSLVHVAQLLLQAHGTGYLEVGKTVDLSGAEQILVKSIDVALLHRRNAVAKGYLKQLSVLVGLIVGYIIALCMGQVDLSGMLDGGLISLPHLLRYRPEFNLSAIISVAIIFMVSAAETIGDSTALVSGGLDREITEKEISGALACDGFASSISGLFGCPPVTSFSQNVGLVNMTKVVNRFTIMTGAVFMILAGLFPPIGNFFASLPQSVLGGCTIMMFGTIMISGIQMLAKTGFSQRNVTIAALSLAIGIGFTSTSEVEIWNIFPQIVKDVFSANCVAVVFVVAIILSLILPKNMEIEKISE